MVPQEQSLAVPSQVSVRLSTGLRLLTGPLIPNRPSRPTDPHTSPRRAAEQTAPTAVIIMGLQEKVHTVVIEMHECPPGFSGFFAGPPIHLAVCKEKKKERMRLFMLAPGGWGSRAH